MIFRPPHGDDCPVCREESWNALSPRQRAQRTAGGFVFVAVVVAITVAFALLSPGTARAQGIDEGQVSDHPARAEFSPGEVVDEVAEDRSELAGSDLATREETSVDEETVSPGELGIVDETPSPPRAPAPLVTPQQDALDARIRRMALCESGGNPLRHWPGHLPGVSPIRAADVGRDQAAHGYAVVGRVACRGPAHGCSVADRAG